MKSLMRIYFSYIATALAIIAAFVVLQVVLLGIVTSKLYEDESGGGRDAIARVSAAGAFKPHIHNLAGCLFHTLVSG